MDIPPEVQVLAVLETGAVYYFHDDRLKKTLEPHYFITLNKDPNLKEALFLVCSSTNIEGTKKRNSRKKPETMVEITPSEYSDFTAPSIIDCNNVFDQPVDVLIEKKQKNKLRLQKKMDISLVEKLVAGVLASGDVAEEIQDKLKAQYPHLSKP